MNQAVGLPMPCLAKCSLFVVRADGIRTHFGAVAIESG